MLFQKVDASTGLTHADLQNATTNLAQHCECGSASHCMPCVAALLAEQAVSHATVYALTQQRNLYPATGDRQNIWRSCRCNVHHADLDSVLIMLCVPCSCQLVPRQASPIPSISRSPAAKSPSSNGRSASPSAPPATGASRQASSSSSASASPGVCSCSDVPPQSGPDCYQQVLPALDDDRFEQVPADHLTPIAVMAVVCWDSANLE